MQREQVQAAGARPGEASILNALKTAAAHHQAGRLHEAEVIYRQTLQVAPDHPDALHLLGLIAHQAGNYDAAVGLIHRAISAYPSNPVFYSNLGNALREQGKPDEAAACCREALRLKPDYAEAHFNLAVALQTQGKLAEAIASYRDALSLKPDLAEAHNNLGNALRDQGRLDDAFSCYRQALALKPDFAEAHNNLGNALRDQGKPDEAATHYREALALKPDYVEAHNNLGNALRDRGELEDAVASYRAALALKPDYVEAHNNLGNALRDQGRLEAAVASYSKALSLKPDLAETHNNLGNVLGEQGDLDQAIASYRRAIALMPAYDEAHGNLGNALKDQCRLDEAIACYHTALSLNPDNAEAHNNLGNALKDQGRLDEAIGNYRKALSLKPDFAEAHSNLLLALSFHPRCPPARCLEEARGYGDTVTARAKPHTHRPASPAGGGARRLRVGLVSGDLRTHPVGFFLESVLAHLGSAVDLVAYPTNPREDDLTARIKPSFAAWKPIVGLNDEAAARRIHDDGVDVLVDLAGHTAHNRLPVFAWKPAPVQVSWLGYFNTTGVAAMDYLIADPWVLPEKEEVYFTEKIWRLPETRLCFTPPDAEVEVSPLPAFADGRITFGCFNNLAKMNDDVIALWGRVLASVPGSRLFLKTMQLKEVSVREDTIERFAAQGVGADRLILESAETREKYLGAYHRVDITLDPFPFPGGTTSVEGLWMGVPVLTLAGRRFLSRQGVGILMNAGLPEWIATDADDYLSRAIWHAGNLQRLSDLRSSLRPRVLASPIFDATRFAEHFEAALRGMWEEWCRGRNQEGRMTRELKEIE